MTSFFTFGAFGSNPLAPKYAAMATKASKCGSKNFVYTNMHDNRHPGPRHHHRQSDVPWRDCFTWARYRWMMHDFRMFGLWGAIRKHYYIGESWRRKDEKIFVGKDQTGNKYWLSRRNQGTIFTRMIEPADPHWFRGQSYNASDIEWRRWMLCHTAHTPAQIKARGEYSPNARGTQMMPFDIKYDAYSPMRMHENNSRDPSWVPQVNSPLHPEHRALEESGYAHWTNNRGLPTYMPFSGVHDFPDELLEEFYRGNGAFSQHSRGADFDEWKQ